jgi:hypothetical protein
MILIIKTLLAFFKIIQFDCVVFTINKFEILLSKLKPLLIVPNNNNNNNNNNYNKIH